MMDVILAFIQHHPEFTLVGAITLVQVAPIKLDPWGSVLRWIRKVIIGDIETKLDNITKKVDDIDRQAKEDKALQARTHILRFADELYNEVHHSKEYFDDILEDCDKYEKYCQANPNFKNSKTVMSTKLIKDAYQKLVEEHKFL